MSICEGRDGDQPSVSLAHSKGEVCKVSAVQSPSPSLEDVPNSLKKLILKLNINVMNIQPGHSVVICEMSLHRLFLSAVTAKVTPNKRQVHFIKCLAPSQHVELVCSPKGARSCSDQGQIGADIPCTKIPQASAFLPDSCPLPFYSMEEFRRYHLQWPLQTAVSQRVPKVQKKKKLKAVLFLQNN